MEAHDTIYINGNTYPGLTYEVVKSLGTWRIKLIDEHARTRATLTLLEEQFNSLRACLQLSDSRARSQMFTKVWPPVTVLNKE